jgi:hypothetical protein
VIELVEGLPVLRASAVLIHIAIKNGLVEFYPPRRGPHPPAASPVVS